MCTHCVNHMNYEMGIFARQHSKAQARASLTLGKQVKMQLLLDYPSKNYS